MYVQYQLTKIESTWYRWGLESKAGCILTVDLVQASECSK